MAPNTIVKCPYPVECFLEGYHEPPTITQDRIKAISSAVIHQSDSVVLTTAMQLHAVHYGYDLKSSDVELQSHATESSESDCKAAGYILPVCMCMCAYVYIILWWSNLEEKVQFVIHLCH